MYIFNYQCVCLFVMGSSLLDHNVTQKEKKKVIMFKCSSFSNLILFLEMKTKSVNRMKEYKYIGCYV